MTSCRLHHAWPQPHRQQRPRKGVHPTLRPPPQGWRDGAVVPLYPRTALPSEPNPASPPILASVRARSGGWYQTVVQSLSAHRRPCSRTWRWQCTDLSVDRTGRHWSLPPTAGVRRNCARSPFHEFGTRQEQRGAKAARWLSSVQSSLPYARSPINRWLPSPRRNGQRTSGTKQR